ncbi:unnamed protein product [Mytilus coruscus]|uniref:Uncharacterized protein n=1 Tax=Mytilus coruscus TaxID=42192 RepID=A0A6J8EFZ0_MYTCO|nr:unnamed protein product [Mytilus coruscus]
MCKCAYNGGRKDIKLKTCKELPGPGKVNEYGRLIGTFNVSLNHPLINEKGLKMNFNKLVKSSFFGFDIDTRIECIKCTDAFLKGSSVPFVVQHFDSTHRNPECEKAQIAKQVSGVTLQRCTDVTDHDQVNKCGRLVGTVNVSIRSKLFDVKDFPIHFHIRGCFVVQKSFRGGCYRDKQIIDQQRGVLSNFFNEIISLQIGEVDAQFCVNKANNLSTWETNLSKANNLSKWDTDASKANNLSTWYTNESKEYLLRVTSYVCVMVLFFL